jgi:hypothetical protein
VKTNHSPIEKMERGTQIMSDPQIDLEYWSYEHEGLLRALEVMTDEIVLGDGEHPANHSALRGVHQALINHLKKLGPIMGDVGVLAHKKTKRARATETPEAPVQ